MEPHVDGHRADHGAGVASLESHPQAGAAGESPAPQGNLRQPFFVAQAIRLRARLILPEFLSTAIHRLRSLFRRRQLDRDLEDELQFHLSMRAEQNGDPVAARRQFGNFTSFKETCRDMWTFTWFETFLQDLRYAVRQLRLHPSFTAVAALTLALGIGATTAIFSMVDVVLLGPMSWVQPTRLAVVQQDIPGGHFGNPLTPADMEDIRRGAPSLENLAAWDHAPVNVVDSGGEPIRVETARVTANFFDVMGVQPELGRAFQPGEDQPGHDQEAILSDDLWRRHFAADPLIAGKSIRVNGRDTTVVGVMPPKFRFPATWRDLWIPLSLAPELRDSRIRMVAEAAGRIKPGHTMQQLAAELRTIGERLEKQYPETNKGRRFSPRTLRRYMMNDYLAVYISMLLGAAFFVLLIACVNVANLQFARATGRWREVAVRTALGAGRRRIVRQLVTESLVLAMVAGAAGLLFAKVALGFIKAGIPAEMRHYMPTWKDIGLNPHALLVALGAALLSAIVAGLLPAWRCSRPNLVEALKEGSRSSGGPGRHRLRMLLVAVQMALAAMLLVGAGLMVRGFRGMVAGQPNLDGGSLLTMRIALDDSRYHGAAVSGFYRDVLAQIRTLPGVRSAAAVTALPYSRSGESYALTIEGRPPQRGTAPVVFTQSASPDYFRALAIPLRAGRLLSDADTAGAVPAAVISERMAGRWWPGEPFPIGKRIHLGPPSRPWVTIVGIAGDIHQSAMEPSMIPIVYLSYLQAPNHEMNVAVRTSGDAMRLASAALAAVRAVDREQPIENMTTLDGLLHQEIFVFAYMAWLMGIFGAVALTLAVVGVYGVMSYLVSQQTHEIGVRIALGAPRGRVIGAVFRRGMLATGVGLAIGLVPAFGLARLLAFAVWGVNSAGAATFVGIPFLLALAAAFAIYIPARRAVGIDPMVALREE
jgi:putative ABC transport system permease protein